MTALSAGCRAFRVPAGGALNRKESITSKPSQRAYLVESLLAPFGTLADDEWRHLTLHSLKPLAGGGYELHHDPDIGQSYRQWQFMSVDLWRTWAAVTCAVLVLRGADSDFLTRDTMAPMQRSGPGAQSFEFEGCGHVPSLMREDQIDAVATFLEAA